MEPLSSDLTYWTVISVICIFSVAILSVILALLNSFKEKKTNLNSPETITLEVELSHGKELIRRIDNLDNMIASAKKRDSKVDETFFSQLRIFRQDMLDLLRSHSIEAFGLDEGTEIDGPTRKLIQVVDSKSSKLRRQQILETVRMGYRYRRDYNSPSTIIRKPEVRIG